MLTSVFFLCSCVSNNSVVNVVHAVRVRKDSMFVAITRLAPFILVNVLLVLWATFSPTGIFVQYPRLFLWMLGLLNSKLVVRPPLLSAAILSALLTAS